MWRVLSPKAENTQNVGMNVKKESDCGRRKKDTIILLAYGVRWSQTREILAGWSQNHIPPVHVLCCFMGRWFLSLYCAYVCRGEWFLAGYFSWSFGSFGRGVLRSEKSVPCVGGFYLFALLHSAQKTLLILLLLSLFNALHYGMKIQRLRMSCF